MAVFKRNFKKPNLHWIARCPQNVPRPLFSKTSFYFPPKQILNHNSPFVRNVSNELNNFFDCFSPYLMQRDRFRLHLVTSAIQISFLKGQIDNDAAEYPRRYLFDPKEPFRNANGSKNYVTTPHGMHSLICIRFGQMFMGDAFLLFRVWSMGVDHDFF